MFRDAIPYSGSVWYIKEIATKKTVAIISKTSIYKNKYDYNNQYVLIDFWQDTNDESRNFTHFYTNIKIKNQQIAQVAKKLFKTLKDNKEERIKEALNLFPSGIVGHTAGK